MDLTLLSLGINVFEFEFLAVPEVSEARPHLTMMTVLLWVHVCCFEIAAEGLWPTGLALIMVVAWVKGSMSDLSEEKGSETEKYRFHKIAQ